MIINTLFEGFGEVTQFLKSIPKDGERARNSALAAVGYEFKKQAKENAKNNVFNWPQLSRATPHIRSHPEAVKPYPQVAPKTLSNAGTSKMWRNHISFMVYEVDKVQGWLDVGFKAGKYGKKTIRTRDGTKKIDNIIGDPIVEIARRLTEGHDTLITPKLARYFWALNLYVSVGSTVHLPKRPVVYPTFQRWGEENILRFFADKYEAAMIRYQTGAAKT